MCEGKKQPFNVGDKVRKYKDGGINRNKFIPHIFTVTEIHEHMACQSGWLMTVKWECECCGSKSEYKDWDSDWYTKASEVNNV